MDSCTGHHCRQPCVGSCDAFVKAANRSLPPRSLILLLRRPTSVQEGVATHRQWPGWGTVCVNRLSFTQFGEPQPPERGAAGICRKAEDTLSVPESMAA